MFLENFYSYNIFFVNIIVFASILNYQRIGIKTYLEKLEIIINGNAENMTVSSILEEFSKMQSHYRETVRNMNFMFTSITIIGLISSYFALMNINTKFDGINTYIDLALFVIIEGVYIITIGQINDTKGDIRTIIGSPTFVSKFLDKNQLGPVFGDIYNENIQSSHNETNIEAVRMNQSTMSLRKSNTRGDNNRIIMDTYEAINRGLDDSEKKIDLIKNMTFRNIIISNQNGISLDWLVLYNKLSEDWQPFKLFSYDITDTQIVQKMAIIIFGLSAIIRLNFKIGF